MIRYNSRRIRYFGVFERHSSANGSSTGITPCWSIFVTNL
jgi:hypothetical protein